MYGSVFLDYHQRFLNLKNDCWESYPDLLISPLTMLAVLAIYFTFVLNLGPNYMKNKRPLKLNNQIQLYNIMQIIFNAFIFLKALERCDEWASLNCARYNFCDKQGTTIGLFFYFLKIFDLLDTVFFVLRKKFNQMTFLHVYHHGLMVASTWLYGFFYMGGPACWVGLVNCLVHMVMYFYYFLTSSDKGYKRNIWWKKHLTQLQIAQHCFIGLVSGLHFFNSNCGFPKWLSGFMLLQAILMFYLFTKFYIKTYATKVVKEKQEEKKNDEKRFYG